MHDCDVSETPGTAAARSAGPGEPIRFAVGSVNGARSSTWRIWTSRNAPDVYLAVRNIAGQQKVSLHASGSWSHSFVSDDKAARFRAPGASRHMELWQRPPAFSPGWTHAYSIQVPWTELRTSRLRERGDVVFVPSPGPGHWTVIEVVLVAAESNSVVTFEDTFFVASLELVDRSEVKVVARRVEAVPKMAVGLASERERLLRTLPLDVLTAAMTDQESEPRAGLYGHMSNGARSCIELALRPEGPGSAVICTGLPVPGAQVSFPPSPRL